MVCNHVEIILPVVITESMLKNAVHIGELENTGDMACNRVESLLPLVITGVR